MIQLYVRFTSPGANIGPPLVRECQHTPAPEVVHNVWDSL
jgi:hypothetical protein